MPAETVTVMFTDIVASTALLVRLGEEHAESVRRAFSALLHRTVASHSGREVKNLGDGSMLVFPSASAAVSAGVALQRAVKARNRRSEVALGLRVAISVGDADVVDGDYFGVAVVEAARLCGAADGGQVLVSEAVRMLARDRSGSSFEAAGDLVLKGLDDPVTAYLVSWNDDDDEANPAADGMPPRLEQMAAGAFVGRTSEFELVTQLVDDADITARRRVALISGEPGIGKSTLCARVARQAHEDGAVVAYGPCERESAAAFRPWRDVLSTLVDSTSDEVLASHVAVRGTTVARLAPPLAERIDIRRSETSEDPEADRYALFAAVVDLLERVSADESVLIVIDDLHWADAPSLALLRHLVRSPVAMRVTVIGTFRDAEVDAAGPLAETLADMHREVGVARVRLQGLDESDLLDLLTRWAGADLSTEALELRDALAAETDGNPFFFGEIIRHLMETGGLIVDQSGRWQAADRLRAQGLPISVREVVGQRAARLGRRAHHLLSCAAVIGREFDLDLLATVVGCDQSEVLDVIEEATAAALVNDLDAGRFAFTHALIEHALYEDLTPTRRAHIHRSVAAALEVHAGGDTSRFAAALARHWSAATVSQDPTRAATYACQAGNVALEQLAPEQASTWFTRALDQLSAVGDADAALRCRILVGLGESQWQVGDPEHRDTLVAAARLALEIGNTDILCEAAVAGYGPPAIALGPPDRLRILETANAATDGEVSVRKARILTCLGSALSLLDAPRAQRSVREAVEVARQLDDRRVLAWTIVRGAWPNNAPNIRDHFDAFVEEALELSASIPDPVLAWHAHLLGSRRARSRAETDEMLQHDQICSTVAEQVGQPVLRFVCMQSKAVAAMVLGRLDDAEAAATEAFAIGSNAGHPDALSIYVAQVASIRLMQGNAEEFIELLTDVTSQNPNVPAYRAGLAAACVSTGRLEQAHDALAPDIADSFASFQLDGAWATAMHLCAEVVANLDLPEPAEVLINLIEPYADVVPNSVLTCYEVFHHSLGELHTIVGRFDAAEEQFALAEETHARMHAPFFLTRTRLSWAEMLLRRSLGDDRQRALDLGGRARATAESYGYGHLIERADRLEAALL